MPYPDWVAAHPPGSALHALWRPAGGRPREGLGGAGRRVASGGTAARLAARGVRAAPPLAELVDAVLRH